MAPLRGKALNWAVTGILHLAPKIVSKLINRCVAASCQAFLLLGYDQGVMSGLVGADNEFGKQFGHPSANLQGISKCQVSLVRRLRLIFLR